MAAQGVYDAPPAISGDGRYVVFASSSPDLAGNYGTNVFVRDRVAGTTAIASMDSNQVIKDGGYALPGQEAPRLDITSDGRYVLFESPNPGLVPGDENDVQDVFVRDLVSATTERASLSTFSREITGPSSWGAISDDGRLVTFSSLATNAIPGDTNGVSDVYVRDRLLMTTTRASVNAVGDQADGPSTRPDLSAAANAIVFASSATNLAGNDLNFATDVFARAPLPAPLPATPVIQTPTDGSILRAAHVTVQGTGAPNTTVTVLAGADAVAEAPVDDQGAWTTGAELLDGTHELRALATNADGERSEASDPVTITIETGLIAPQITVPADGASLSSALVQIAGTADPGSTVTVTENTLTIGQATTDDAGTWTLDATFGEGSHSIRAVAQRGTDVSDESSSRTFLVDATAPSIPTIDTPLAGAILEDGVVEITGTAEPAVRIDLTNRTSALGTTYAGSGGNWNLRVPLANGAYEVTARASDRAGNASAPSVSRSFTVAADTGAPEVSFDASGPSIVLSIIDGSISGTARDDAAVDRVELTYRPLTGAPITRLSECASCGSQTEVTWSDSPVVAPGHYKVGAQAVDARGKRSRTVWIDAVLI